MAGLSQGDGGFGRKERGGGGPKGWEEEEEKTGGWSEGVEEAGKGGQMDSKNSVEREKNVDSHRIMRYSATVALVRFRMET